MKHLLAQMNLRLAERLGESSNVFLLDADRWMQEVAVPESPKMWYAAKSPIPLKCSTKRLPM